MTGPAVVALGGGHGLAASLRAARTYAGSITAVVSVADDGGSSGRLRVAMPGLPAPGDIRRCLSALAADGSALARTLEYRFDGPEGDLRGHAFGNLLLATLTRELGSFPAAVDEVARLVGAVGRVLPATVDPVALVGEMRRPLPAGVAADERVLGQVAVQNTHGLSSVSLWPIDPASPPAVADAIRAADQIVIGPGSLFTSVLATAVVPAVRQALAETAARRVYVANLAPQVPETKGFSLADHLHALAAHGVPVDVVLRHDREAAGSSGVAAAPHTDTGIPVATWCVADDAGQAHHPDRLGAALAALV